MKTSFSNVIAAIWFANVVSAAPVVNAESASLSESQAQIIKSNDAEDEQKRGSMIP